MLCNFLANFTAVGCHSMIGYWHDTVICLSVCLSALWMGSDVTSMQYLLSTHLPVQFQVLGSYQEGCTQD